VRPHDPERASTLILPVRPGRLIGGKYVLTRRLGSGSMGEVWLAHHQTLHEGVALKLLTRAPPFGDIEDAASAAARFRLEAQVAARLSRRTRHIVRVTDHGEEGALAYLVMEVLEGLTLDAILLRRGCMPPARVTDLVVQIARGLEHAHAEGVVHRDLKPANVFLTRNEDGAPLVKILDFGIARLMPASRTTSPFSTAANVVLGTPGYMSPEHSYGMAQPDAFFDLWALATVAYEALTGELPVPGLHVHELLANLRTRRFVPIHERDPGLPGGLAGFFERAFAERASDRYSNAAELAHAFQCAISGTKAASQRTLVGPIANVNDSAQPVVLPAASAPLPLPGFAPSHWTVLRIAAGGGLIAALGIGAAVVLAGRAPSGEAGTRTVMAISPGGAEAPDPVPSGAPEPETVSRPVPEVGEAPSVIATTASATSPRPRPAAPPTASSSMPPRAASAAGSVGCTPPYDLDSNGNKRWKRECL
jgi:serine/threonine protein kinase